MPVQGECKNVSLHILYIVAALLIHPLQTSQVWCTQVLQNSSALVYLGHKLAISHPFKLFNSGKYVPKSFLDSKTWQAQCCMLCKVSKFTKSLSSKIPASPPANETMVPTTVPTCPDCPPSTTGPNTTAPTTGVRTPPPVSGEATSAPSHSVVPTSATVEENATSAPSLMLAVQLLFLQDCQQ